MSFGGSSSSHTFGLDFADRIMAPLFKLEKQLERLVTLPDRVAAAFDKIKMAISGVQQPGAWFDKAVGRWRDAQGHFIVGTNKWVGAMAAASAGLGALAVGVSGLVSLMEKGIEYGIKFGKTVVEAAKERGLVMTAYEVMLGSRDKAEGQLQKTLDIASLTPSSNMEIIDLTKRLLTAGFQGHNLDATRAAATDIQAAFGSNRMNQFAYTMAKVQSKGELGNADVNSFGRYINARYIRQAIAEQLGDKVGLRPGMEYTDKIDKAVRDLISKHGVNSAVGMSAAMDALLKALHQKQLGAYAEKKGVESLAGVLSNMEEIIPTFLMRLNIDKFEGIKTLKNFLVDVLGFFNLGTKEGKMLAGVVEDLTNALFGGLKNITKDDMSRFFTAGVNVAKQLVGLVKDLWTWVEKILHGDFAGAFAGALNVLIDVFKVLGAAVYEGFKAAFGPGGKSAAEMAKELFGGSGGGGPQPDMGRKSGEFGFIPTPTVPQPLPAGQGVLAGQPAYGVPDLARMTRETMAEVGQAGAEGFKQGAAGPQGLDAHSPSRAMERIGRMGADGLKKGAGEGMGGMGFIIHGDVHVHVQADSVEEKVKFQAWLLEALREVQEEAGAA